MLKIKYKSYEISQTSNNHVSIFKDNKMVFHTELNKKLGKEEELKEYLKFYLNLVEKLDKE